MSSLEEEGCGESLYLSDGENLAGRTQSDQKMMEIKAMFSFLFQMKLCPQKCLIFADMLRKFLLSHQIALLDSWRHTSTIRQENCPLLPKSLLDVEDVNTGD